MGTPVEHELGEARTVKPRNRVYKVLPVIALNYDGGITEDGELIPMDELIEKLPLMSPTLFAMVGIADWIGYLDTIFRERDSKHWQWRATSHERDICRPDGVRIAARVSTLIHYFGFQEGNYAGGRRVYHKAIDPVSMYGHSLDTVYPDESLSTIERTLRWAVSIRDFCAENQIEVRPTIGSISAQFLTDRRFYPKPRRKVPAKINERVRENLVGNYYHLNVQPSAREEFTAIYLDQHRAHHYHARTLHFPDANHLYAHGRFCDLAESVFEYVPDGFMGLYCLDVRPPKHPSYPSFLDDECCRVFVYSNEIPHLLDLGYEILGIRAAWGSYQRDRGLNRFAQFAESQLDRYKDTPWLKPLLLSTYGTLAIRPLQRTSVFRLVKSGTPARLHTGHFHLDGMQTQSKQKIEPGIANVLHRGMIEAATRSESIGLAQYLTYKGHQILSIYADAVIVKLDEDNPLPLLPDPWRSKGTLNHLQFINQQAFMSGEMTKLPGVTREIREYRQQNTGPAPRMVPYIQALSGQTEYKQIGTH